MTTKLKSRKAQMELIGIAVVMVLIILGVTFYLTLSMKAPSKTHESFMRKELSQNIVDSIVKSRTTCKELDFATVLEDCAKYQTARGSLECEPDGSVKSCAYAEQAIGEILENVLGSRYMMYTFTATITEVGNKTSIFSVSEITSGDPCTEDAIKLGLTEVETPGIQPIPLYPGTLTLMLRICHER